MRKPKKLKVRAIIEVEVGASGVAKVIYGEWDGSEGGTMENLKMRMKGQEGENFTRMEEK